MTTKLFNTQHQKALFNNSKNIAAVTALGFAIIPLQASAFHCSIFEGSSSNIPSFITEIAALKNMDNNGRHIKVIVPKQGPVQEFDIGEYVKNTESISVVKKKLSKIEGGTVVYIDLYPNEKRYEIRMGRLTTDLQQVIAPTVYANFAYNKQHNEVYDLQSRIAVFCN
ncbi:MAG: hypothetical protein V7784_19915 [Oceanospirillaceae bacterium]